VFRQAQPEGFDKLNLKVLRPPGTRFRAAPTALESRSLDPMAEVAARAAALAATNPEKIHPLKCLLSRGMIVKVAAG
jgi:hypothetical protein